MRLAVGHDITFALEASFWSLPHPIRTSACSEGLCAKHHKRELSVVQGGVMETPAQGKPAGLLEPKHCRFHNKFAGMSSLERTTQELPRKRNDPLPMQLRQPRK